MEYLLRLRTLASFRAVVKAFPTSLKGKLTRLRQGEHLRETRHWDEARERTHPMRTKESSDDYRYFPEPDLPPLILEEAFVEEVRDTMPRLPDEIAAHYTEKLGLTEYDAQVLTLDPNLSSFFDRCGARRRSQDGCQLDYGRCFGDT